MAAAQPSPRAARLARPQSPSHSALSPARPSPWRSRLQPPARTTPTQREPESHFEDSVTRADTQLVDGPASHLLIRASHDDAAQPSKAALRTPKHPHQD